MAHGGAAGLLLSCIASGSLQQVHSGSLLKFLSLSGRDEKSEVRSVDESKS